MEPVGAISEGAWNSFNGMCSEEADFMAQLLGSCSLPHDVPNSSGLALSSSFWPIHDQSHMSIVHGGGGDDSAMYSSEETNTNVYSLSQESSYSGGSSILFPSAIHDSYYHAASHQFFATNNNLMMMDNGSRIRVLANNVVEGDNFLNQDVSNDSMESNENVSEDVLLQGKNLQLARDHEASEELKEDKSGCPSEMSKKRARIPGEAQRNKRGMKMKKCNKTDDNNEENNNANNNGGAIHRQGSSSYCSEDDSNASQELNGVTSSSSSKASALNLNGKTRAGRGSATDPQSLYARKRRERINERLRILQNLVPNGTKVDISTMLEEAVQYVKFLQLQIKLLSSDDLWMYAPIAYNGMDIGLDLKISTPKSQST